MICYARNIIYDYNNSQDDDDDDVLCYVAVISMTARYIRGDLRFN